jgi:hypothetical protein
MHGRIMASLDTLQRNYNGNPNQSRLAQERGRLDLSPSDIPKQIKSLKSSFKGSYLYKLGSPSRPSIMHDKGHLVMPKAAPTLGDKANLLKWKTMTAGGETFRPDLVDALAAYNHFLNGKGVNRTFAYDRYVSSDRSGRTTLNNAINHIKLGVIDLWIADQSLRQFNVTGPAIPCGASSSSFPDAGLFPYPETENWQKAIGAHTIWLTGKVNVSVTKNTPHFYLIMTLHAEDMYNFNPGQKDIRTGIPDSENGRFTQVRLAHPYLNTSTLVRSVNWKGVLPQEAQSMAKQKSWIERDRQPKQNRMVWNLI